MTERSVSDNTSEPFYLGVIARLFIYRISRLLFGAVLAYPPEQPIAVIARLVFFFADKPEIANEYFCDKREQCNKQMANIRKLDKVENFFQSILQAQFLTNFLNAHLLIRLGSSLYAMNLTLFAFLYSLRVMTLFSYMNLNRSRSDS